MGAKNLSPAEQDYLIAHAALLQRAMSLRGLQGQGAGSDQRRTGKPWVFGKPPISSQLKAIMDS